MSSPSPSPSQTGEISGSSWGCLSLGTRKHRAHTLVSGGHGVFPCSPTGGSDQEPARLKSLLMQPQHAVYVLHQVQTPQAWSPQGPVSPGPGVLGFFTSSKSLGRCSGGDRQAVGWGCATPGISGKRWCRRRGLGFFQVPTNLQTNTAHVFLATDGGAAVQRLT